MFGRNMTQIRTRFAQTSKPPKTEAKYHLKSNKLSTVCHRTRIYPPPMITIFTSGWLTGTSEERRTARISLAIEWEYTSGKVSAEVERMTVHLPIGIDQTSEAR